MAHLEKLRYQCHDRLCEKRATVRLIGHRSDFLGYFCQKHGEKRLDEVKHEFRD